MGAKTKRKMKPEKTLAMSEGRASTATQTQAHQRSVPDGEIAVVQPSAPQANAPTSRQLELMAAIQVLHRKLQIASAYNTAAPDHGRSSARIALLGVLEFLSVLFPDAPTLPLALQDLLQGLVDLDRGTTIPLLKASKGRGRSPNPLSDDLFRALVAAAMTSLMRNREISRELAARDIAGRLNKLGYRLGRLSHVKLEKWREKMMTESVLENLAVQRYQLALRLVKDMKPDEAATFLLQNLTALYPAEFPKKGTFK